MAPGGVRPRMLLVDDTPLLLSSLRRVLRSHVEVVTADSAEAALEHLAHAEVHVVVTDYRMPTHDGLWLLGVLSERYPTVRRVLTSSWPPSDLSHHVDAGVVERFYHKSELLDSVEAIVQLALSLPGPAGAPGSGGRQS